MKANFTSWCEFQIRFAPANKSLFTKSNTVHGVHFIITYFIMQTKYEI